MKIDNATKRSAPPHMRLCSCWYVFEIPNSDTLTVVLISSVALGYKALYYCQCALKLHRKQKLVTQRYPSFQYEATLLHLVN